MKYLNLYKYFDYRKLLDDYYRERKAMDSRFSYRFFNLRAGIKSVGLYQSLVKGEVNISSKSLPKIAKGLDLDERELEYFKLMVDYTHALTSKGKQDIFEEMLPYLPKQEQRIARSQKEYYSHWYNVAAHQSLWVINFTDNFKELAQFINPRIKISQARRAIQVLKELNLIAQDRDGFWRPIHSSISGSGKEVGAFAIQEFQNHMMDRAKESQFHIDKTKRNIITTTMSISNQGRERLIQKISQFQKEIQELVLSDSDENQVCQLNIQFFPITQELEKENQESNDEKE
jgi:uncharacterized protein (TIGR02147 family)